MRLGDLDCLADWLNVVLASLPIEDYKARTAFSECLVKVNTIEEIKAEPVRHGRWVKAYGMMPPEYHGRKCCSVCDAFALSDFYGRERLSYFCPNCGTKMDLEEPTNE